MQKSYSSEIQLTFNQVIEPDYIEPNVLQEELFEELAKVLDDFQDEKQSNQLSLVYET